jgi:SPP1 family predicted phage head-tail adaptor
MDAGQFDRRIVLQRAPTVDDGLATVLGDWVTLATVWAKYIPISGAEMLAAGESASFNRVRFKIRNDSLWSDLNATDRLLFDDIAYNIEAVRSEGRGFFLIDAVARGDGV